MADNALMALVSAKDEAVEEDAESLEPYGGRCYWCLALAPGHSPAKCGQREKPDMTDFEQRKPHHSKRRSGAKAKASGKARAQTSRTTAEQKQHRQGATTAWKARDRELRREAKARAADFARGISEPIAGVGPFGTFTLPQLLGIEFAQGLPSHLSPETLCRRRRCAALLKR